MGIKLTNLTLPEWAFLDATSHEGNLLEGRTVIQHIRSYTILEALALEDVKAFDLKTKPYNFDYKNSFGIIEKHIMLIHFSLASESELDEIAAKAITWYCNYLAWEDANIETDSTSVTN